MTSSVLTGSSLADFIIISLIVLITPGPGVLYVVARGIGQGCLASVVSALGLSAGVLMHVFAAAIGLSAIVLTSTTAFMIVKYIGAAYLIYLGVQAIRSKGSLGSIDRVGQQPFRRLFWDGVVVSTFNPKIAVFFLAFLPQFVDPSAAAPELQIFFLGLLYAGLAFFTDSVYGLLAASLTGILQHRITNSRLFPIITGSLLIGVGIRAALSTQRS